ncbi:MAG: hypothetical protein MI755_23455 [Sphingomonadales bacterium]|nr:hypothetical protein [Sphingomonadales bacterium]
MQKENSKSKHLEPPVRDVKAELGRTTFDTAIQLIPGVGSLISGYLQVLLPSKGDKGREFWEDQITEQVNRNATDVEELSDCRRVSIEGFAARFLAALIKDCPDGLRSKHYEIPELMRMFPGSSKQEIQDSAYDLQRFGLVNVMSLVNGWRVRLAEDAYEQVDHQFMDWNTREDARVLANLMIEMNSGDSRELQANLGWERRRFNPALRMVLAHMPERCIRRVDQFDYVAIGLGMTAESRAALRHFLER